MQRYLDSFVLKQGYHYKHVIGRSNVQPAAADAATPSKLANSLTPLASYIRQVAQASHQSCSHIRLSLSLPLWFLSFFISSAA